MPPSSKFPPGSVVWARVEGYPFWPARVCLPQWLEQFSGAPKNVPSGTRLVQFFNDNDQFIVLELKFIKYYRSGDVDSIPKRTKDYKRIALACEQAERYRLAWKNKKPGDAIENGNHPDYQSERNLRASPDDSAGEESSVRAEAVPDNKSPDKAADDSEPEDAPPFPARDVSPQPVSVPRKASLTVPESRKSSEAVKEDSHDRKAADKLAHSLKKSGRKRKKADEETRSTKSRSSGAGGAQGSPRKRKRSVSAVKPSVESVDGSLDLEEDVKDTESRQKNIVLPREEFEIDSSPRGFSKKEEYQRSSSSVSDGPEDSNDFAPQNQSSPDYCNLSREELLKNLSQRDQTIRKLTKKLARLSKNRNGSNHDPSVRDDGEHDQKDQQKSGSKDNSRRKRQRMVLEEGTNKDHEDNNETDASPAKISKRQRKGDTVVVSAIVVAEDHEEDRRRAVKNSFKSRTFGGTADETEDCVNGKNPTRKREKLDRSGSPGSRMPENDLSETLEHNDKVSKGKVKPTSDDGTSSSESSEYSEADAVQTVSKNECDSQGNSVNRVVDDDRDDESLDGTHRKGKTKGKRSFDSSETGDASKSSGKNKVSDDSSIPTDEELKQACAKISEACKTYRDEVLGEAADSDHLDRVSNDIMEMCCHVQRLEVNKELLQRTGVGKAMVETVTEVKEVSREIAKEVKAIVCRWIRIVEEAEGHAGVGANENDNENGDGNDDGNGDGHSKAEQDGLTVTRKNVVAILKTYVEAVAESLPAAARSPKLPDVAHWEKVDAEVYNIARDEVASPDEDLMAAYMDRMQKVAKVWARAYKHTQNNIGNSVATPHVAEACDLCRQYLLGNFTVGEFIARCVESFSIDTPAVAKGARASR